MKNNLLIMAVIIILFSPLFFSSDAQFLGADSLAEEQIQEMNPNYKPWFQTIFEPSSGEVESLLFALQAAMGAGFIGYCLGLYKGRKEERSKQ